MFVLLKRLVCFYNFPHTHTHTHARTHARTRTHTHTHYNTTHIVLCKFYYCLPCVLNHNALVAILCHRNRKITFINAYSTSGIEPRTFKSIKTLKQYTCTIIFCEETEEVWSSFKANTICQRHSVLAKQLVY